MIYEFILEKCSGIGDWSTGANNENWACCTESSPCGLGKGNCNSDDGCLSNLRCGSNNCPNHFHSDADCCSLNKGMSSFHRNN